MAKDEELIEREDHRTLTVAEAVSAIAGYCRAMADYGKEPKFSDLPNVLGLRAACVADRLAALAASPSPVVGYREAIADSLKHCKALILSTGREIPVADGKITLPGDLTDIERTELLGILSFFTPAVVGISKT